MRSRKFRQYSERLFKIAAVAAFAAAVPNFVKRGRFQVSDGHGQYDWTRRNGRHGHRRPVALRLRHDGPERDRLGRGRAVGHFANQRNGRRPRPQDQDRPGRRRQRLADVRREGGQAARAGQDRRRLRLLDLCVAEGGASRASKKKTGCSTTRPFTKVSKRPRT